MGWVVVGAEWTERESRRAFERGIIAIGASGEVDSGEELSEEGRGGGAIVRDMGGDRGLWSAIRQAVAG